MQGSRGRLALLAVIALVALPLTACGDEGQTDAGAPPGVPAAGENTPPSGTPGVPENAPYNVDGHGWRKLNQAKQFEAATAYIEDYPSRCENADVAAVAGYVTNSYGFDFPLDIAAVEVLAEGCDASRQS